MVSLWMLAITFQVLLGAETSKAPPTCRGLFVPLRSPLISSTTASPKPAQTWIASYRQAPVSDRIRDAARSVFRLTMIDPAGTRPVGEAIALLYGDEFNGLDLQTAYQEIRGIPSRYLGPDGAQAHILLLYQMKKCFQMGLTLDTCLVSLRRNESTVFVGADARGPYLMGALHTFRTFTDSEYLSGRRPLEAWLFGDNGSVLYGPEDLTIHIDPSVNSWTLAHQMGRPENEDVQPGDDSILLRTSKRVGLPLVMARELPFPGDEVYLVGFPGTDNGDSRLTPMLDRRAIAGASLLDLEGTVRIARQNAALEWGLDESEVSQNLVNPAYFQQRFAQALYFQGLTAGGMSGGPILNSRGEVVTILSYSYHAVRRKSGEEVPARFPLFNGPRHPLP